MSYEGYVEYLCEKGHHWAVDSVYDEYDDTCPRCNQKASWSHDVDETNGVIIDEETGSPHPNTIPAQLQIKGYEDEWHEDHYGNKYATRYPLYHVLKIKED